jgi:NADH dehydrogenase FAD-containing subunit
MAYLGDWRAVFRTGTGSDFSGRTAWLIWRGAYLTKSVSWRNKVEFSAYTNVKLINQVLICIYWTLNWLFGRDISRF